MEIVSQSVIFLMTKRKPVETGKIQKQQTDKIDPTFPPDQHISTELL